MIKISEYFSQQVSPSAMQLGVNSIVAVSNFMDEDVGEDDDEDEQDRVESILPGRIVTAMTINGFIPSEETHNEPLSQLLLVLLAAKDQPVKTSSLAYLEPNIIRIDSTPKHPIVGQDPSNPKQMAYINYGLDELRQHFHLPIIEVARILGVCPTLFKKICRKNKISRWPYRQIRSITKCIQSIEVARSSIENQSEKERYNQQIARLHRSLDQIMQDPNTVVSGELLSVENIFEPSRDGDDLSKLNLLPMKYDVTSVIAASVAAADLELASSSAAKKRKLESIDGTAMLNAKSKSRLEEELLVSNQINFGLSRVDFVLMSERAQSKPKLEFIPPVNLAPLLRRPPKHSTRIVPLIEPDICNYMKVEVLPSNFIPLRNNVIATPEIISQLSHQIDQYELRYKQMHEQQQQQLHMHGVQAAIHSQVMNSNNNY